MTSSGPSHSTFAPGLLSLPPDLLLAIATKVSSQLDRVKLSMACRAFQAISLSCFTELEVDLEDMMGAAFDRRTAMIQQHSLRSWVMRRRHSIRSLSVAFPGNESLEGNLCLMPLICALAATLAETGLQRLRYTFTCEVPWMDALVPLGPSPLRELTICDCHLPELPQALTTLPCLTSLEIGVCQGFAEHLGGVEGMGELSRLTNLRSLALHHAAFGAAPGSLSALTRLTALDLAHNVFTSFEGVEGWSTLTSLARLDLSSCEESLAQVPDVLQHFTSLRTLLLAGNNIDAPVDAFGDEFGVEQQHPQGVPLALSALRQLEELDLRGNYFVRQMPQAFLGLTSLTRLLVGPSFGGLAAGPYLANLQELYVEDGWHFQPSDIGVLSAAPRLRRLSLRHLRVPTQHATPLPAAVWQLQHLTYLNLSKSQLTSFPEGPYTASLQELCADGCAPRSAALMQTLPAFPLLRHVIWADNSKLPLSAVRHLLAQAPGLKVLGVREDAMTAPARKALSAAHIETSTTWTQSF